MYDYNIIIEVNGIQHYSCSFKNIGETTRSIDEEQENDKLKKQLAFENGFNQSNYIIIDAKKSDLEYLKQSIFNSLLTTKFDIFKVNWNECSKNSNKSIAIEVKDAWNNGIKNTQELSKLFDKDITTIIKYLKNMAEIGLCDYKPYYQSIGVKHSKNHNDSQKKKVLCIETGQIFDSILDTNNYGFCSNSVSRCCNGKQKMTGGYHWSFLY